MDRLPAPDRGGWPEVPADPGLDFRPPDRPRRGSRLRSLLLWAESKGWRFNLLLLALTVVTTTVAGGGFLLTGDPLFGGLLIFTEPGLVLREGIPYSLSVIAILGAHEMGHYLACLRYGVAATPPFFLPVPFMLGTLGAVIRIRETVPTRRALFDIGIAGPLAGFVAAVPVMVAGVLLARSAPLPESGAEVFADSLLLVLVRWTLRGPMPEGFDLVLNPYLLAGWLGMLATAMNLMPTGQLDGGHVCYAISRRLHRLASRTTVLALAAVLGYATLVYASPVWLVWLVALWLMGPRHPPLLDEVAPLPASRWPVALLGTAVFILSFTPVPIYFLSSP